MTDIAFRRRQQLQTLLFWLRSAEEPGVGEDALRCFVAKARAALDEMLLDLYADEQELDASLKAACEAVAGDSSA